MRWRRAGLSESGFTRLEDEQDNPFWHRNFCRCFPMNTVKISRAKHPDADRVHLWSDIHKLALQKRRAGQCRGLVGHDEQKDTKERPYETPQAAALAHERL